jgi:phage terminase large subunit-like protein
LEIGDAAGTLGTPRVYPFAYRTCQTANRQPTWGAGIEDKASGPRLIQELIDYGLHAVTRYQPQSDKIMRMHAQKVQSAACGPSP